MVQFGSNENIQQPAQKEYYPPRERLTWRGLLENIQIKYFGNKARIDLTVNGETFGYWTTNLPKTQGYFASIQIGDMLSFDYTDRDYNGTIYHTVARNENAGDFGIVKLAGETQMPITQREVEPQKPKLEPQLPAKLEGDNIGVTKEKLRNVLGGIESVKVYLEGLLESLGD